MPEMVTTTSISEPWSGIQPYLTGAGGIYPEARTLYQRGGPGVYEGPRVAGLDYGQQFGGSGLVGMAMQNPLLGLGQEYFANTLGGAYLQPQSNPYLSGMYQSAAEDITNQFAQQLGGVTSRFGQSGRTGSPGMMNALSGAYGQLGRSLAGAATDLYGRAYESERGRQQQMAQFLPQMLSAEQGLYTGAVQGGQLFRDYNQQLLDAQRAVYEAQQARPYQNLQYYANLIQPGVQAGSSGRTTAPSQTEETPLWETLLGIGGSLLSFFSDERLKKNIAPLGQDASGLPLYRYHYKWEDDASTPHIGVMAQDVAVRRPDALGHSAGYMTVDYGRL